MTVFSLVSVFIIYYSSVYILCAFSSPEQITAFTAMYKDMMLVVSIIVGALLGVQGAVDWKFGGSNVSLQNVSQTIHEIVETSKKDDDYELS
jgi:hypothetical protein